MPFSNPIIGGESTLIRPAIRSPDYVAGSTGWSINRDGSAELNNVTIRGDFATGAAGGPDAYLTINDSTDRTTIAFWNPAGTNDAFINSPQFGTIPQLGANSGVYDLGGSVNGRSRLFLTAGGAQLERVRESDQAPEGGQLLLSSADGRLQMRQPGGGAATGGRFIAGASAWMEYESAGTGVHGIRASSDGVHTSGTFVSDAGWSAVAGTNWSITTFDLFAWGPFVALHFQLQRINVGLAGGNIPDETMVTVTSAQNPPSATIGFTGTSSNNIASCNVTSGGVCTISWLGAAMAVGESMRFDAFYHL